MAAINSRAFLDQQPKLSELQRLTQDQTVCSKWEEIGIALGLADQDDGIDKLEELETKHSDPKKRMLQVFKNWLRESQQHQRTWGHLLQALRACDLHGVAGALESNLGGLPQQTLAGTSQGSPDISTSTANQATFTLPVNQATFTLQLPVSIPLPNTHPTPPDVVSSQLTSSPVGNRPSRELPQLNVTPISKSYDLKMKPGQQVRRYQRELARPGINGTNCVIIAPTGSGKTLVSALVISHHLKKNQSLPCCHVVFIVPTKPLADQQKERLEEYIPEAKVGVYTGDTSDTVADSIRQKNEITVCTAGKILQEIRYGQVQFDDISLIIFDECHHTKKQHPYAQLMMSYLEYREDSSPHTLPQIVGMTASPGAGGRDNPELDKVKTIDHLLNLAAQLNATGGFHCVTENVQELQKYSKNSSISLNVLRPRDARDDHFICHVVEEMVKLEQFIPALSNCNFEKWSQKYETMVHQLKSLSEISTGDSRDQISTLEVLICYSNALSIYRDLQQEDAIKVLKDFTKLQSEDAKATPRERQLKSGMEILIRKLNQLPMRKNPLLEGVEAKLCETFQTKRNSRAILFVRTKLHAYAMKNWVRQDPRLSGVCRILPDVITGHRRETGSGMTQLEQEEVMENFRKGITNLLIATSVAEEGLDVPECNLMIRYLHVSDEIARVQTEGRARAEDSQGIVIVSSDSSKQYQELKNKELNNLVDEILESRQFPTGDILHSELLGIQQQLVRVKKLKAAIKAKVRGTNRADEVTLLCKKCKAVACSGSDVYKLSENAPTDPLADDGTCYHYVVPKPEFKEKLTLKVHSKPRDVIKDQVRKTHKIHCKACDADWGVLCIWPAKGSDFPVLKCVSFTFMIQGTAAPRTFKKWGDVTFEMQHLSLWQYGDNSPDTSFD